MSFFIMLVSQNCSCQLGAESQEIVSLTSAVERSLGYSWVASKR